MDQTGMAKSGRDADRHPIPRHRQPCRLARPAVTMSDRRLANFAARRTPIADYALVNRRFCQRRKARITSILTLGPPSHRLIVSHAVRSRLHVVRHCELFCLLVLSTCVRCMNHREKQPGFCPRNPSTSGGSSLSYSRLAGSPTVPVRRRLPQDESFGQARPHSMNTPAWPTYGRDRMRPIEYKSRASHLPSKPSRPPTWPGT
jgi:hypothetical protein